MRKQIILNEGESYFGNLEEEDSGFISLDFSKQLIKESDGALDPLSIDLNDPVYFYAILQKYGVENRNGRWYSEEILRREAEKYRNVIAKNTSWSELDHPNESTIALSKGAPFRVVDLFWKNNILIGKLEILVSKGYRKSGIISCGGDMLCHYLEYGQTVGVSSRGVGTLKKINGKNVVQNDYELICWDGVSTPSVPGSYIFKNPSDLKKYDEVIIPDKGENESSQLGEKDNQSEFVKKLNRFLKY